MNNNNIGWIFRLITDDISLAKENTALVFDSSSIFLGSGDIVCYQPQTIQYYIILDKVIVTNIILSYTKLYNFDCITKMCDLLYLVGHVHTVFARRLSMQSIILTNCSRIVNWMYFAKYHNVLFP